MNFNVTKSMANARNVMLEGAFQQAGSSINDTKNMVREVAQKKTAVEIKNIIDKLKSKKSMADYEVSLIKAWMIGDAIAYTKMENNFQDWLDEYERLENSLAEYENKDCTPEELFMLHGILEDASRVSYDIAYFLENQDRIKRFEEAVAGDLNENGREILAKILLRKLESPEY
jgi:hypothetical protein